MNPGREPVDLILAEIKASGMIPIGGVILELGTGRCYDHWALFEEEYTFIPSDKYIQDYPEVHRLDAEDFASCPTLAPYPAFHAILAIELLEHCPEPLAVLKECHTRLNMGGLVVVTTPFYHRIHEGMLNETNLIGDYWRFTPRGMAYLFQSAGFQKWFTQGRYKAGDRVNEPSYVVGWAQKCDGEPTGLQDWHVDLPDDWREKQVEAEARWSGRHPAKEQNHE